MSNNYKDTNINSEQFVFERKVQAIAHKSLNNETLKWLWFSFSSRLSTIEFCPTDELVFSIGNVEIPSLDGKEYAVSVAPDGVCVVGQNEKALIHGYIKLISMIKILNTSDEPLFSIENCILKESPLIDNRMVHFCVFPETELWELERFVRFCGVLRYTHIVLEFWGMIKYDCLKELAWEHAFTKDQIKPIIQQAKELGIEVIPMFNHWGHASSSRAMHGKHVVLDQNPSLQPYFSDDGWCWDISKSITRDLLRQIRFELMELCGDGEYFHIGCDEAYGFVFTKENMDTLCKFINEVNAEMQELGKKIIMWGDMLVYKSPEFNSENKYFTSCPDADSQNYMISNIDKSIIIGDWQYWIKKYPVETSLVFKEAGFDCLICPWDVGGAEIDSCMDTVKKHNMFGVLHTTWHTLSKGMPYVLKVAASCWQDICIAENDACVFQTKTAMLLRKSYFVECSYEKSGWAKGEIDFNW